MHEVKKGVYVLQFFHTPDNPQFRLDCALRMWGLGKDVDIDQDATSHQDYNRLLLEAPATWGNFPRPSFGQEA